MPTSYGTSPGTDHTRGPHQSGLPSGKKLDCSPVGKLSAEGLSQSRQTHGTSRCSQRFSGKAVSQPALITCSILNLLLLDRGLGYRQPNRFAVRQQNGNFPVNPEHAEFTDLKHPKFEKRVEQNNFSPGKVLPEYLICIISGVIPRQKCEI